MKLNKSSVTHVRYSGHLLNPAVRDFLAGRVWLRNHTPFSPNEIDRSIKCGWISTTPGIQLIAKPLSLSKSCRCNRCFNTNPAFFDSFTCACCGQKCVYCRHCIRMGRVSQCTDLITWKGPLPRVMKKPIFQWSGQFSPLQQQAADELIASIREGKSHLVHAVCGAGKTEILFPAVFECLKRGYRVCVATPRTDVVLELFPRFQKVFPDTTVQALYGGADQSLEYAPLVIATTHQLYRFQDAFDIIIVDEADAFPYTADETLQMAVRKAKKDRAPILYVTATPSKELITQVKKQQGGYSFIPRRFHGHPLPVPRYDALWKYDKIITNQKLPLKLEQWTRTRIKNGEPFLIFFPTIALMEQAIPLFQTLHPMIKAVSAEDPDRKEKVLQLRNEQVKGLLTTTILERGITIPKVQVAVVGAESAIFNSSALIQISGRVGRSPVFADGDVVFFHHGISIEMDRAKREIIRLNRTQVRME